MKMLMIAPVNRMAHPSLFNSSVVQSQGFHPTLAGGFWLGQDPAEWYRRAKTAIAKFDELLTRVSRIAAKVERERILTWIGTAATEDSPAYRYAMVKNDLQADVEAYTPPNVNAYQVERRTNRIEKLEEFNQELETMAAAAENTYGVLPEATIVERTKIEQIKTASPSTTNWTLPILIATGAVAVAVVVTLIAKKG